MENTKLLFLTKWIAAGVLSVLSMNAVAMDETIELYLTNIEKACPKQWENPSVALPAVSAGIDGNTLFFDANDKLEFSVFYKANHQVSSDAGVREMTPDEIAEALSNSRAIAAECNSYRKDFFTLLITTNDADESTALAAATGVAKALDFISSEWRAGDMRMTGRESPDAGWLFPVGQTIGAAGSIATDADDKYKFLFEIAKKWAPNTGDEVWGAAGDGGVVKLPDMRGRAIYGAINMGGEQPDNLTLEFGNKLGLTFGDESTSIEIENLPAHNHANTPRGAHGHTSNNSGGHKHTVNQVAAHKHQDGKAGVHSHTVAQGGSHSHKLLTSAHTGSSGGGSGYYIEGKIRPNYQNTITRSVQSSPTHAHALSSHNGHTHSPGYGGAHMPTMLNAGTHNHVINPVGDHNHENAVVGNGDAVKTVSPGIVMNVEIKY